MCLYKLKTLNTAICNSLQMISEVLNSTDECFFTAVNHYNDHQQTSKTDTDKNDRNPPMTAHQLLTEWLADGSGKHFFSDLEEQRPLTVACYVS